MKKICCLTAAMMVVGGMVFAQNGISANGKYVFVTEDKTLDRSGSTLLVQSTDGKWKKEIRGGSNAAFTVDGKMILYSSHDTLFVYQTGSEKFSYLAPVTSYKISPRGVLAAHGDRSLRLLQLPGGKEIRIANVSQFDFTSDGTLYYVTKEGNKNACHRLASLTTSSEEIWAGSGTIQYQGFNKSGERMVFLVSDSTGSSIWQYHHGKIPATRIINDGMKELGDSLVLNTDRILQPSVSSMDPCMLTEGGTKLLFYAREKYKVEPEKGVDVWSYTDVKPMDWQLRDLQVQLIFAYVADLNTGKIMRLEQHASEKLAAHQYGIFGSIFLPQVNDSFAIVLAMPGDAFTLHKNGVINGGYSVFERAVPYIVSLHDGSRRKMVNMIEQYGPSSFGPYFQLAPQGSYVVFFNKADYYSYHIPSGKVSNLTEKTGSRFVAGGHFDEMGLWEYTAVIGYVENDPLIRDRDGDVWRVNAGGETPAVCLTNGYLKQLGNGQPKRNFFIYPDKWELFYKEGQSILCKISADRFTTPGYYMMQTGKPANPSCLLPYGGTHRIQSFHKADKAAVYLVGKENAVEPLQTFITRDLKSFSKITGGAAEQRMPGITTEVHEWTMHDGNRGIGLLLKPKDFDPSRKYPVIVTYYEKNMLSHDLYSSYGYGHFTDHGYLVFCPDIYFTLGQVGKSMVNSVVSGAEYIARLPYVDAKKMGLHGGSFGGLTTNYLVTHSNLFAAAISIAGYSDLIGNHGIQDYGQRPHEGHKGAGQNRSGATLWERPDVYIANSPLFYADRVTAPILLVHGRADDNVPFEQSISFFRALRSLGKTAWLLQYDGNGHMGVNSANVGYESSGQDLTIRKLQFFNHYLKGAPAPHWMLKGIPARMKGKVAGLELDNTGRSPGPGIPWLNGYERSPVQKELLKHRTKVNDEGRIVPMNEY